MLNRPLQPQSCSQALEFKFRLRAGEQVSQFDHRAVCVHTLFPTTELRFLGASGKAQTVAIIESWIVEPEAKGIAYQRTMMPTFRSFRAETA